MTKAQLEEALARANERLAVEVVVSDLAAQDMRDAEAALAEWERFGFKAWNANNSPGSPVCVSTDDDDPQGYSVCLYMRGGTIVGVEAYRKIAGSREAAAGLVPVEEQ